MIQQLLLLLTLVSLCHCQSYQVSNSQMNWFQAAQYCQSNNGKLVKITTSNEESQASEYLRTLGSVDNKLFWIGLTDLGQEGRYVWEDGSVASYFNWYPGEPNDADGTSDCIHMDFAYKNRQWTDSNCYIPNTFAFCQLN